MKFLCVPCDSPMKLQTIGPPEGGSLSVVYSCPECGYEMAMLTNPYETQVVQSLGVRIGPATAAPAGQPPPAPGRCPFSAMMPAREGAVEAGAGRRATPGPVDGRRRSAAREHSRVRAAHGADRHRGLRPGARDPGSGRRDPRRGPRPLRHVRHRPLTERTMPQDTSPFARPYVVSWNLTYRCNLACEHCYLDAGGTPAGRHGQLRGSQRARHRGLLPGHRRDRRVRARVPDHPDRRRAAAAARHPRDRPARGGAWTVGRRRHQRRAHHREPGAAPGGGRRAGAVPVARRTRSGPSRPLPEGAWRVARTPWMGRDPAPDRAAFHRADDRRARTISASSRRSPTSRTIASPPRSGTSISSCRRGAGSSCRTSPRRSTTRCSPRSTGSSGSTSAGCS